MIVNFSVENFGPIKDKQTLSFEAEKSTHLEEHYVIEAGGVRLLKMALIYGANASGKTTVLKALQFLRDLVLEPKSKKTDELDFQPFLFDKITPYQNSKLSIAFIQNKIKYFYEVEFSKKAVVYEKLDYHNPNKANILKRSTDLENKFTEITFGSKIKKNKIFKKTLEANTLWNNTVLGGFLKTNIDFDELDEVLDWFEDYLQPLVYTRTDLDKFVTTQIDKEEIFKNDIVKILKKADFHISDIAIKEEPVRLPFDFLKYMESELKPSSETVSKLSEMQKFRIKKVDFEHTVNGEKFILPLELESEGTKRYYGFAGLLAILIQNSEVIPIDELEDSLHPDLYTQFILSFLINSKHSQIIATTHNREILNDKNVFRNDAIWFTDKSNDGATELYSLADFDSSVIRNTTNILNAYKSGKLSGVPNLGDYFIDLN